MEPACWNREVEGLAESRSESEGLDFHDGSQGALHNSCGFRNPVKISSSTVSCLDCSVSDEDHLPHSEGA